MNDISSSPLIVNMIFLIAFLSWSFVNIFLGVKLLGNRPVLIPAWLPIVPRGMLSLMLFLELLFVESDIVYIIAGLVVLFLFLLFFRRYFSGYSILDAVEEDLLDCLKTVADKHNISYTQSKSRFMLGNNKNFVEFFASGLSSANIYIDKESFPASKEFVSDLRLELEKRTLEGLPKMGPMLLLGSFAILCFGFWFFFRIF